LGFKEVVMGDSLIYWSDSVWLYHAVCFGSLALLVAFVIWPEASGKSGRLGTASFLFVLCIFVVAARWPGLFYPRGFNPDEDQLVAAARALVLDPVFFRAAEAGSSGPLNVYPLLASLLAGTSPTLFSARLVGLGIICIALVALYFAGRAVFSESVSRFGAFFPGVFFGLTNYWDFTHYTSEHVPMALLAVGWTLSAWAVFRSGLEFRSSVFLACLAACTFSMVPFAKLQATMAALGASALLVAGVFAYGRTWRERCAGVGIVCAAGVVIPLGLVGFFTANGALEYFWTSYIQNALAYQGSGYRGSSAFKMLGMILFAKPPMRPEDFLWFAGGWSVLVVVSILALVWSRQKSAPWRSWSFLAYTLILLGLAVWTVTAPQRNYPHYLLFLPVPMGILVMALSGVLSAKVASRPSVWRAFAIGLFLLVGAGPMIYARLKSPNSWAGLAQKWSSEKPGVIAQKILQASGGEGRLCVWGYNPTYYSETGLVQATRLSTSGGLIGNHPLRPFFLLTYLHDLTKNKPSVFVDAVAPDQFVIMTSREEHGHEVVPEVREFVAAHYELFDEIKGVRIYRWKTD
jgi:hypothetical protein